MKKIILIAVLVSLLVSCGTQNLELEISDDKFDKTLELPSFDIQMYINKIEPVLSDLDYIRLDSVFIDDDNQNTVVITDHVVENILQIYNVYEQDHSTYELINFLDIHIKKIYPLDVDILVYKIIKRIEKDFEIHNKIVDEDQFNYLIVDYITRITDTFIKSYDVTADILADYPNMRSYLERLKMIVDGGYQIRRYNDSYYMFPDYAAFLERYKDYYNQETADAKDILVRESRNIVFIADDIQINNEAIAYKTDEIEGFMKLYPNSVYYDMMRAMYTKYFHTIVSNPDNIEEVAVNTFHYKEDVMVDFNTIVDRYSDSQMARILEDLITLINENDQVYDDELIAEIRMRISTSY